MIDDPYPRNITARFVPSRTNDLQPGVAELIGKTLRWRYAWTMDDDESDYPGERIWLLERDQTEEESSGGLWFPESDLEIEENP